VSAMTDFHKGRGLWLPKEVTDGRVI